MASALGLRPGMAVRTQLSRSMVVVVVVVVERNKLVEMILNGF
jgi:hypothetical protein